MFCNCVIPEPKIEHNCVTWPISGLQNCIVPSFFLPFHASAEGFTGVILTYNKLDSLFVIIRLLAKVASLRSIVVVWNHSSEPPPSKQIFYSLSCFSILACL